MQEGKARHTQCPSLSRGDPEIGGCPKKRGGLIAEEKFRKWGRKRKSASERSEKKSGKKERNSPRRKKKGDKTLGERKKQKKNLPENKLHCRPGVGGFPEISNRRVTKGRTLLKNKKSRPPLVVKSLKGSLSFSQEGVRIFVRKSAKNSHRNPCQEMSQKTAKKENWWRRGKKGRSRAPLLGGKLSPPGRERISKRGREGSYRERPAVGWKGKVMEAQREKLLFSED